MRLMFSYDLAHSYSMFYCLFIHPIFCDDMILTLIILVEMDLMPF